ncbi:hypothetical protein [Mycolicibacterium neworleansense]|uniref:Secreted protein n=1 Tax=Mycolicibacterium neworleansense TaxID=146018 RepID=A0A0H5RYB0_9MYCO|nr:hypothetical protein [Mycolicibacterium neworleansense]MCV7361897.1 hypothetical protein [Mycolicibacterium neworleansense]CRZ13699.1 hypothetical protein BN2156_00538 [Mycolicibacterium neworleansense]
MCRALALGAAALTVVAGLSTSACAHADPEPVPPGPPETTAPQPEASCAGSLAGALTPTDPGQIGNDRRLLQCADGRWQAFGSPYPSSDRWLTTGPELILHGQGRRNPEAQGGTWTATPQTAEAHCSAEVVDVVAAGRTSGPKTSTAAPGQPLTVEVSDHMFTVKLSGYCLWARS